MSSSEQGIKQVLAEFSFCTNSTVSAENTEQEDMLLTPEGQNVVKRQDRHT